jgi:hypothetical protein
MADLAAKHRLPTMFTAPEYTEAGGLMAYGEDPVDRHRRLATYVAMPGLNLLLHINSVKDN